MRFAQLLVKNKQEALLLQRDRAMRYVSKFVLRFMRYGS